MHPLKLCTLCQPDIVNSGNGSSGPVCFGLIYYRQELNMHKFTSVSHSVAVTFVTVPLQCCSISSVLVYYTFLDIVLFCFSKL